MPGILDDNFAQMFGGSGQGTTPTNVPPVTAATQQGAGLAPPPQTSIPQQPAPSQTVPNQASSSAGIVDSKFDDMFGSAPTTAETQQNDIPGSNPSNPINISPVSGLDRMKLNLGNTKGGIDYLKKQYSDVAYDPKNGIVVKDNDGLWKQVNPSGLGGGDAWDKTKEIGKTILSHVGDVGLNAATVTGALALAPETGGASVAAAAAGGAGSGVIRTSLGRLVGTYEATPEEQIKDTALESLMSAGGQTLGLGMRPLTSRISAAVTNFAQNASDAAKQAMSGLLSQTTGVARENMDRLMERAPQVMEELDKVGGGMPSGETQLAIKSNTVDYVKNLVQNAQRALSGQFDAKEKALLSQVPEDFEADIGKAAHQALTGMSQNGLVRPATNSSGDVIGYKVAPREEIMDLFHNQAEGNGALSMQAYRQLKDFVSLANGHIADPKLTGSDGVEALMNVRRAFDNFYFKATAANDAMKDILTPSSSAMRNNLVEQINSASPEVASLYKSMNDYYKEKMPFVAEANRISRRYNGAEAFVNQISSHEKVMANRLVDTMAELKGDAGQELSDRIKDSVAAQDFVSKFPQKMTGKLAGAGALALGAHATGLGPVAALAGAAASPAFSPRLVGRTAQVAQQALPYMNHLSDFLKQIPKSTMTEFIRDPNMLAQAIGSTAQSFMSEQPTAQALLQSHGVTGQ